MGLSRVPILLASNGFKSNTSIPSIAPRVCNLSRPVDWLKSVGTSPGLEPSPNSEGEAGAERRMAESDSALVAAGVGFETRRAERATERNKMGFMLSKLLLNERENVAQDKSVNNRRESFRKLPSAQSTSNFEGSSLSVTVQRPVYSKGYCYKSTNVCKAL